MAFQHPRFTRTINYLTALWAFTPHFHLFDLRNPSKEGAKKP